MKLLLILSLLMVCGTQSQDEEDPYLYEEAVFMESVSALPHFVMFFAPW